MRLARYLAHSGVASRRAAERLVAGGRVAVAGELVMDPARDVDEASGVTVDGRPVAVEEREVWALNKPEGVVSTAHDTHGRRTVTDMIASPLRLYPVGRLDAGTTGLLLLTNDGALAELLTHPRHGVEKVYRAAVTPPAVGDAALRSLRTGVELEEGTTAPAGARQVGAGLLELRIREGRKRQVRRMCEAVGHRVTALQRVGLGPLALDRLGPGGGPLAPGQSRQLTAAEIERLRESAARTPRRSTGS